MSLRVVGRKAGAYALVGDIGKGLFSTTVIPIAFPGHVTELRIILVIGFAVVIGHCYSVFLGFHGGKGVATALGTILGIDFILGLLLLGVWVIAVAILEVRSTWRSYCLRTLTTDDSVSRPKH